MNTNVQAVALANRLLELNVLNVQEIERHLKQLGARSRYPQVKKWLLTVARKYILNKIGDDEASKEYEQLTRRPRRRDQFSTMPDEVPEWVGRELERGGSVHFFKDIQPRTRRLWNDIEAIIDYFNHTLSPDDPVLNRLDRISFDQARADATAWRDAILSNPWKHVRDKPPVVMDMGGGWRWVELTTPVHTKREGQLMNHCVGGGGYRDRGHLYSLRDPENMPHITIHEVDGRTSQIKGNSNQKPDKKYQRYLRPFLQKMGIAISGDSQNVD